MIDLSNDNIIHIRKDDIEYIQFKKLLEYETILKHSICFKPLDFNLSKIGEEKLEENYKKICRTLEISYKDVVRMKQTHSDNVEILDLSSKERFYDNTDGIITQEKNIVLPIVTADCISLLLFDPQKKVIANIHSGWRGTVQRIVEKAIKKMVIKYGCRTSDIICCIGPCIGKCHFEVREDVKEIFEKEFKDILSKNIVLDNKKDNTYFIDTVLINRLMLIKLGLKNENIIESNICTVCNKNEFHSYRAEKERAGRNLSIITLV